MSKVNDQQEFIIYTDSIENNFKYYFIKKNGKSSGTCF